ncbi:Centrin-1 [Babesia sp. Xinjiang]|uniref:Centrin-1 n=1 Tax=Babesia sp. Xinjiang TaxID=462227 RepID=UPI000A253550|nr:Centrin-1 [Babesia sp. Xinjiang]ORM41849.1 Centrin-1 [Babesia sp. Xinjiang]
MKMSRHDHNIKFPSECESRFLYIHIVYAGRDLFLCGIRVSRCVRNLASPSHVAVRSVVSNSSDHLKSDHACLVAESASKLPVKAILLCGGIGQRMSDTLHHLRDSDNSELSLRSDCPVSKQFVSIHGIPVFIYSFTELLRSPIVSELVISTKREWNLKVLELIDTYTGPLLRHIASLGESSKCRENLLDNFSEACPVKVCAPGLDSISSHRISDYKIHLGKFPFFVYDLEEHCCILSTSPSWSEAYHSAIGFSGSRYKIISLCISGASRAGSVYNALERKNALGSHMPGCCRADYIALVHDSVRPLLGRVALQSLVSASVEFGGALPAVCVFDTIKTPQAFRASILKRAYVSAFSSGDYSGLTDDSSFVERVKWAGKNPGRSTVPGLPGRRRRELSDEQLCEIKDAFSIFDTNGSGHIEAREFKMVLKALGFDPSTDEMYSIMSVVDKEGTGSVSYDDYFKIVKTKILDRDPMEEISKAFKLFADPTTGTISLKDLRRVADELGEVISDDELGEMIKEADRDNDGVVNESDFKKIMLHLGY